METSEPDLIWTATLEDRFVCAVKRTGDRTGLLVVMDKTTEQPVFSKDVGLSYGAAFGPDMDDVQDWQETIVEELAKKGLVTP